MVEKIKALFESFVADAEKAEKGNKAAGARARKTSLELGNTLKEFRKESISWGK